MSRLLQQASGLYRTSKTYILQQISVPVFRPADGNALLAAVCYLSYRTVFFRRLAVRLPVNGRANDLLFLSLFL